MDYGLGVDLGTTHTAAAVWVGGRVEVVRLGGHRPEMPSVVFVRPDGEVLVGDVAERRGDEEPGRLARDFKRRVGDEVPILVGGSPYSGHALMARLLRHVVDTVTRHYDAPPRTVTVAHPANWGPYKRELLAQAVRLDDLADVRLRTEPELAAIQYAAGERVQVGEIVAVYDLGGGTFDAAVLRKTAEGFELLGEPQGKEHLGGVEFDEAVLGHVRDTLGDGFAALDVYDDDVMIGLARLRRDCVKAKEDLSFDTETMIPVALPGLHTRVRLNRSEFEAMIAPRLEETVDAMRRALRWANVEPERLRCVLLAGGSSRIPLVAQLLTAAFGQPIAHDPHPEYSTALGAAQTTADWDVAPAVDPWPSAPVSGSPIYAAPVSAPPTSAPPVSAPPTSAPPVSAPPVSAPPVSAPPVSAPPVSAPPVSAPPVSAPPVSAPPVPPYAPVSGAPVSGAPIVAGPPITAPPVTAPAGAGPVSGPPAPARPVASPPITAPPITAPPITAPPITPPRQPADPTVTIASVPPTSAPPASGPPAALYPPADPTTDLSARTVHTPAVKGTPPDQPVYPPPMPSGPPTPTDPTALRRVLRSRALWTSSVAVLVVAVIAVVAFVFRPGFGGDPSAGGTTPEPTASASSAAPGPPPTMMWQEKAPGPVVEQPSVGDALAYVAAVDKLLAYDRRSGTLKWEFAASSPIATQSQLFRDVLYITGQDGRLYAINPETGKELWKARAGTQQASSPRAARSSVFVGSADGRLYAFTLRGESRWQFPTKGPVVGRPGEGAGGTVFVGSADGNLYAVDGNTGRRRWTAAVGPTTSPILLRNIVLVGGKDKSVFGLDAATGKVRWSFPTGGELVRAPAITDGPVAYVGGSDGVFYAIDSTTGKERWRWASPDGKPFGLPTVHEGMVYVGSESGKVYAIDAATGRPRWEQAVSGSVIAGPRFIGNQLFVGDTEGTVYGFELPPAASPAATPTGG